MTKKIIYILYNNFRFAISAKKSDSMSSVLN